MPLHLLPKKSWNVYNADNIARVRRDEAAAKAKEEAEEQRMQEYDAQRRLAILRGEIPHHTKKPTKPHKPWRRHWEIQREAAASQRRKEYEDQFSMRLANAAGKDGLGNPWYVTSSAKVEVETPSRNAWGNEDPLRKQRDAARLVSSDPLAMMKMGAAKVREVKKARQMAQQEREEELRALKREERHREKRAAAAAAGGRGRGRGRGERRRSRDKGGDRSREERHRRERSRERDSDGRRRKRSRSPEKERRRDDGSRRRDERR
ncbi:unnamed protein product [Parascedosporium putredinis]|uniref:CBF1-interacting co-repressor CIR N-terminal domain-containing protein n=1 Tax=Parascedosporium putredinis TaxID=1442378 RepID=A0A9P1H8J8_9PEZI|nr:unnamed protein product [Parascedosporium putredinis]CAI7999506.1 unnamed protein product [Parascedosporium putredinis]